MRGTIHQAVKRARLHLLALTLLLCAVPTAQAIRCPTPDPTLDFLPSQLNEEMPSQEQDASGNVLVTYTRGLDLSGTFQGAGGIGGLLARTDSNGSAFYHADAGGNITSLTDASGHEMAWYLYDAFGRLVGKRGALADVNVMQFSSMPVHRQSGLSLYPFRAYDPALQRWLNQDPIGEAGGINLYGFVGNNPINAIDPDGLDSMVPGVNGTYNNSVPALTLTGSMGGPVTASYPALDPLLAIGGMTMGGMAAAGLADNLPGTLLVAGAMILDDLFPTHLPPGTQIGVLPFGVGAAKCPPKMQAAPKLRSPFPPGARFRFSTMKAAREAAERASPVGKAVSETGPEGPHYHPLDAKGNHLNHDHYYFPERFW